MLFPHQMEVDIAEVDDKKVKVLRIVVLKGFLYDLVILISPVIPSVFLYHFDHLLRDVL